MHLQYLFSVRKHDALILSIPHPCSENWEAMTPAGGGRHCASCNKTVVDFTGWSDEAVAAFFSRKENGSMCGKMRAQQLGGATGLPYQPQSRLYCWVMAAGIAAITLAAVKAGAQTPAYGRPPHLATVSPGPINKSGFPDSAAIVISGTVFDKKAREPVPFATVYLLRGENQIWQGTTDIDGMFAVDAGQIEAGRDAFLALRIESGGYLSNTIRLDTSTSTRALHIVLVSAKLERLGEPALIVGRIVRTNTILPQKSGSRLGKRK